MIAQSFIGTFLFLNRWLWLLWDCLNLISFTMPILRHQARWKNVSAFLTQSIPKESQNLGFVDSANIRMILCNYYLVIHWYLKMLFSYESHGQLFRNVFSADVLFLTAYKTSLLFINCGVTYFCMVSYNLILYKRGTET